MIEDFFRSLEIPGDPLTWDVPAPVRLSDCEFIADPQKFIRSHLEVLRKHNGNPTIKPVAIRLVRFKKYIELWKTNRIAKVPDDHV